MSAHAAISAVWGDPFGVVSSCLRGLIAAEPGREFIAADFSNIEGRVIAWAAGQADKVELFRKLDETGDNRFDPYRIAYGSAMGLDPADVTKDGRQVGKAQELGLGFQGGVRAFLTYAAVYLIDLDAIAAAVRANASQSDWDDAAERFDFFPVKEVSRDVGIACQLLVLKWRAKHPQIVEWWHSLFDCATSAVENPGRITYASGGKIAYRMHGRHLACRLPSGRFIWYPLAKQSIDPKFKKAGFVYHGLLKEKPGKRGWVRAYGGLLAENCTQAIARDLLRDAMLRLEAKGFCVVGHVHDEIISEGAAGFGCVDQYCGIMCASEPWAAGLPVAAEGWRGRRFRK